jgi:hypothetical protein
MKDEKMWVSFRPAQDRNYSELLRKCKGIKRKGMSPPAAKLLLRAKDFRESLLSC